MNRTQIILAIVCLALISIGVTLAFKAWVAVPVTPPTSERPDASSESDTKPQDNPAVTISWPLFDGVDVRGLGEFRDAPIENGVHRYSSDKLRISFNYPGDYMLFENRGTSESGIRVEALSIVLDASVRELIASTAARGLPPAIRLSFYAEPDTTISLKEWIRSRSESNFDPAYVSPHVLTPTTVAGAPAFSYRIVGMYDTEYVAFRHNEWIVLATFDTMDGQGRQDFQTTLSSMRLK